MEQTIYLDNNSTTPLDPAVLEAMLPYFTRAFGNPSNTAHDYGREAADAVERARLEVAQLIGAKPKEIVFTSGATESNNLAILGAARKNRERGEHVVTVATEHKAVLLPCKQLEREGFHITYLPVDRYGQVDPEAVRQAITDRTILVTIMVANNEVGTLQPVEEIGRLCGGRGVLFHSDAAQALGKIPLDVNELGADLLSISAHKMYGPKGVGALFVHDFPARAPVAALQHGGGQEEGLRSGTHPVPNLVGMGKASEIARRNLASEPKRTESLRERLKERLQGALPAIIVHGHPTKHLPGLLNIAFPDVDGDTLIFALRGLAVSQGSSCAAGSFAPSHVLRAMGVSDELARASLRFGVGRFTTDEEIDRAADIVLTTIAGLRRVTAGAQ